MTGHAEKGTQGQKFLQAWCKPENGALKKCFRNKGAGLAQLVEHLICKTVAPLFPLSNFVNTRFVAPLFTVARPKPVNQNTTHPRLAENI